MTPDQQRALAFLRKAWPEKAAEVERLLASAPEGAERDAVKIEVGIKYRLEKFDGDYVPGMRPVEVIEGEESSI